MLLGAAMLTSIGTTASASPKTLMTGKDRTPWSRMHKAQPAQRWSGAQSSSGFGQKKIGSHFTSPASDIFEYIYGPDGSMWYAVTTFDTEEIKYEYYTEYEKKGFTITFYDSKFNEIGKIRDKIRFEGNETRCVQVSLSSQVTQKFFNYDSNYEVMVSVFMNTPEYVTNSRTLAYSITKLEDGANSTPIKTLPGYPIDEVNCARDKWSEDFYFTFMTEELPLEQVNGESLIEFLGRHYQILTTYGHDGNVVMEKKIRLLDLPGDQMSSPVMLNKNVDGNLALIYARYEKSFFENPAGQSDNENITEDNHLIIETYRMNDAYPREMELINTAKIETKQNTENPDVYCTYYGIGNLTWDNDVDFGNYTTDGRPAYIVSADDYLYSDDDHMNSSYYVYDADGNRIKTIAENTFDRVVMADIPGFEPQIMFINMGDKMNFQFVDLYSCRTVTEIDHNYRGYGLSTSLDRVATADGYAYASALSTGIPLDDTHLAAPVCWIDSEGEFIRLDKIPTGEGVELAQIYMNADGLSPYIFNTDSDHEYMLLVKRRIPGQEALREELLIASPEKGVLHSFTDDKDKGNIRSIMLMGGSDPELLIIYQDDNYKYTTDAYSLPFTKFAGGSGTEADPYMIATGGDLQQIKSAPAACYKLANDIDCAGIDFYPIDEFTGVLDGDGHVVKNLSLISKPNKRNGLFAYTSKATIRNLDFYNVSMLLSGGYEAGVIAATAGQTTIENVHVRRLKATGESFSGEFGGIVGKMWTTCSITACEIAGAEIDLPSCTCAGGIAGDIRTGCKITSCAFSGNMTTANTLGGIVGSTTTGDEVISQCHVDAYLKAENTVGGIVGFLDRSKVRSNYVEGKIEATKPSKWNKSLSLGGIAGELEGDWQGNADVPIVNNLIGVSELVYPDMSSIQEDHPRQLTTVHRVAGRTSYNAYYEEEPTKVTEETGILNNFVVSDLAVIDPEYADNNIEGTTMDKDEVENEWLENNLGFAYGTESVAPWNSHSWYAYDPSLYYESIAYMPIREITVMKGSTFDIEIAVLSRVELSEDDIIGGFMCEYNEEVLSMTGNMSYDGKTMKVEFQANEPGESAFKVSILGNNAECLVKVTNEDSSVEGIASETGNLTVAGGVVSAEGCSISIYDINGKAILKGNNHVGTSSLTSGIYVATATDKSGRTTAVKFVK